MAFLPRIILLKPSHPGNIGAVARSMKTMGLDELYLVSPKKFPDPEATALATHASDILEKVVIVDHLTQALTDIHKLYASSANTRRANLPIMTPRMAAKVMSQQVVTAHRVAILFGPESTGLSNQDLLHAHAVIQIPTSDSYRSLNIAQAVQIIAYEYFIFRPKPKPESEPEPNFKNKPEHVITADITAMENFYHALERSLIDIRFLNPEKPTKLMSILRQLFNRQAVSVSELNILRGILTAVSKAIK